MRTGAALKILHVVHVPADKPDFYHRDGERDTILPFEDLARRMLGEFLLEVRRSNPELHVLASPELILVSGLPVTRIAEIAQRETAGLIVMGQNKHSRFWRRFFAPLSKRVARQCAIPMKVMHPAGSPENLGASFNRAHKSLNPSLTG